MTGTAALPAETTHADGEVFGWLDDGTVTALIIYYTEGWSLCPRAGTPEDRWPPSADDGQIAALVRERTEAGGIASLGPLIGGTRNLVFWVPAAEELGGGIFAVKADLPPVPCGYVLPRGVYAFNRALRTGAALPSLDDLLADEGRVDLGPRFPLSSLRDSRA